MNSEKFAAVINICLGEFFGLLLACTPVSNIFFPQGVQAQTVANFLLAFEGGLAIIPVLNKVRSEVYNWTINSFRNNNYNHLTITRRFTYRHALQGLIRVFRKGVGRWCSLTHKNK